MDEIDLHAVVRKLVGPIQPTGDHGEDGRRLANIKELTALIDGLVGDVMTASQASTRQEASMKAIGMHALEFLNDLGA